MTQPGTRKPAGHTHHPIFELHRFGIITKQSIRCGSYRSLKQLIQTIERYITNWNTDCKPFAWTATSEEILAKVSFIESEVRKMLDCNAK